MKPAKAAMFLACILEILGLHFVRDFPESIQENSG
jgi:hypothetical protein